MERRNSHSNLYWFGYSQLTSSSQSPQCENDNPNSLFLEYFNYNHNDLVKHAQEKF